MRVLYERCCGLDIHQASIAACALSTAKGKGVEETRRFGTMTADLLELTAWLKARDIQQVAMESTGVYWKPVWNILEPEGFDLLLANAQEVKVVPGRKTDQKDSQWIADLHANTRYSHPGSQLHLQSHSEGFGGCQHQVGVCSQ